MNKKIAISLIILALNALTFIFYVIHKFFFPIPLMEVFSKDIINWISKFFQSFSLFVFGSIFILYMVLLVTFVSGYNITKRYELLGSIIYVFSLFGFIIVTFFTSFYTFVGLLFLEDLSLTTRITLFLILMPFVFMLSFFLLLSSIDFYVFFIDLIKARKIWKHDKPEYNIEERGKMTYINIETDQFIFTPIPILIIAKHLQDKEFSISWFVKGAFNHLLSLLVSYFMGWPRARNKLFRFMGMKIGKNCHISQRAKPDPLLPELIEFKEGSGCGIGVKLLTHNAMKVGTHESFGFGPITVGENARIGAYSLILPGVSIGKNSIIGSNSVVTKDVPPNSIAHGVPAKVIRKLNEDEQTKIDKRYR